MIHCIRIPPQASALYLFNMRKLVASYGVVLGTNYFVVFVLLMVIYYKILRHIRKMRATNGKYLNLP